MIAALAGLLPGSSNHMLLAAGEPVIVALMLIMFVFVPLAGLLVSKMREMTQTPSAPSAQRTPADPARIQSQIDEFLRRATQRRVVDDPKQGALSAARQATIVNAEVVEDEPIGDRVGREVNKYLDTSDFRRRSQQLGENVSAVDQQFKQQVQTAFSGEVSTLAKRRGTSADAPEALIPSDEADDGESNDDSLTENFQTQTRGSLTAMFASPQGFVQSIVMTEILRRPDWDKENF